MHSKVFGIGFHKTGTTSLKAALEMLGYRVTGPNFVDDEDVAESVLTKALAVAPQFNAYWVQTLRRSPLPRCQAMPASQCKCWESRLLPAIGLLADGSPPG